MAAETVLSSGFSCHCGCHDSGFETCPYCERHSELHVSAPVNVGEQSNSPAPRNEARPKPAPAGRYFNPFVVAIAILTPIIFCLPFYLYGTGISDVKLHPFGGLSAIPFPELSAFDQSMTIVVWAGVSTVLATIGVSVVRLIGILIGMSLCVIFWPLKPLKPILFLPVVYPFIGAWTAIRYSVIGIWLIVCFGVRLTRNLLLFPSFFRRHLSICNICNGEYDCCASLAHTISFSLMIILMPVVWVILAHRVNGEPVPMFVPVITVSLFSANLLSGLYELGRWYHNKRAPQATKEKPNPIV